MSPQPLMKIAYTMPQPADDEGRRIAMLIDGGWDAVHLRHPGLDADRLADILRAIPRDNHPKIVLHDCFSLAGEFGVGALHLNSRNPRVPEGYLGATTASCHSIAEVMAARAHRYVTLSPIFDSISKPGYRGSFSAGELQSLAGATVPVIALGGISPDNIATVARYPFAGYAVMGALDWGADLNRFLVSANNFNRCFNS